MLGVGVSTSLVSADRRSQLFRLGITPHHWAANAAADWNTMVDYTGYAALIF